MAKENIPYLGAEGLKVLWNLMKDYYSDALRGDVSSLETTATTVVDAINELYSSIDSIVNAPKISEISIQGDTEIASAGLHEFTATYTPGAEVFLVWGVDKVASEDKTIPAALSIEPLTGQLRITEGTNGKVRIFVIDAISGQTANLELNINTTIKADSIDISGVSLLNVLGDDYDYGINVTPENASTGITWSLPEAPEGWSINPETGKLRVRYNADFYSKEVTVLANDSISGLSSSKKLSFGSALRVIFPNDLETISPNWYNSGKTAPKTLVTNLSISDSVTSIESEGLAGFTNVDLVIPSTVTTFGEGSLTGLKSVSATPSNYLAVKEVYEEAVVIGGVEEITITGLLSKYTTAEKVSLSVSKTPSDSEVNIVWSVTGEAATINRTTGELTILGNYHNSKITVKAEDLITGKIATKETTVDTIVYATSFAISGLASISTAGTSKYTITNLTPSSSTTDITWSCNSSSVTLVSNGKEATLTTRSGLNTSVTITATDSLSKVSKSLVVAIDTRVALKNLSISGPTTISAAGNYTYEVTYDEPIPDTYRDITISCSSNKVSISTSGVLTVPADLVLSDLVISVVDSISKLTDSITVSIDTNKKLILTYEFENELPGNANGYIQLSTTSSSDYGNYEVYYGDASGKRLANYQAINYVDTVTNTSDNDNIPIILSASSKTARFEHFISANALPLEAKTIVACKEGTTAVSATYPIPNNKLMSRLDLGTKSYSIGMISDIHIDSANDTSENDGNSDLDRTIKWFKKYGVSAICSAGDVTDDGEDNQWQAVRSIITSNNLRTASQNTNQTSYLPFYISSGNHDARKISTFKTYTGYETYNVQNIGEDVYIFCGLNNSSGDILSSNFTQLSRDLETYKSRARVFVFQHVPIPATNGNAQKIYAYNAWTNNSNNPYATNNYSDQFATLMKKYDNVILINGHSHLKMWNQVFDKTANYYRYSTGGAQMLHLPSLTYPREWQWDQGTKDYTTALDDKRRYNDVSSSEACVLDVYEKGVVFRSFNCEQQKFIGIAEYVIETESVVPETPPVIERPEEEDTTNADIIFHFNGDLTSAKATSGYSTSDVDSWFINASNQKITDTAVKPSSDTNKWVHKFTDASLMSQLDFTGTVRTIGEWTMLAEVYTTSDSTKGNSDSYQRAICDSPSNYNGGFNIDYYPGHGFVVNVMQSCPIGATVGTEVFTGNDDSKVSGATSCNTVKVAVKRKGDVYQYTIDGVTWTTATNNIQDNTYNKSFTIGGTGGTGSHPFFGHVYCDIYETSELDQNTIDDFFGNETSGETVVATLITVTGDKTITAAGNYRYKVTTVPSNAVTNLTWSITGSVDCTIDSRSGILTVPTGVVEVINVKVVDSNSNLEDSMDVSVNIEAVRPSDISPVLFVDRNYNSAGVTGGYTTGTGYYLDSSGVQQPTLKPYSSSSQKYSDKFDTSLISAETTGYRFLSEWTMMALVEKTSDTSTTASTTYTRAICDTPGNYNGGINIDYYPGHGFVANVMKSCAVGKTVGENVFTGNGDSTSENVTDVENVKLVVRRFGETVEYSTDFGATWITATNNFQENKAKVFTIGGTNSVNNPFYGHVKCAIYDKYELDGAIITSFFDVVVEELTGLSISGDASITKSGTYKYTVIKTPANSTANLSWSVSGVSGVTINSSGELKVLDNAEGTVTITVLDGITGVTNTKQVTVNTVVVVPDIPESGGGSSSDSPIWKVEKTNLSGSFTETSNYSIAASSGDMTEWTLCAFMYVRGGNDTNNGLSCGDNFKISCLGWGNPDFIYSKIFGNEPYGENWQCQNNKVRVVNIVIRRSGNTVEFKKGDGTWTTISNPSFGTGNLSFTSTSCTWGNIIIRLYNSALDKEGSVIQGFFNETASIPTPAAND